METSRPLRALLCAVAIAGLLACSFPSDAATVARPTAGAHVLVRFTAGATPDARRAALRAVGGETLGELPSLDFVRIALPARVDLTSVLRRLSSDPAIAAAEPDAPVRATFAPDDAYWSADPYSGLGQWGWRIAQVDKAWDQARGSSDIIVATIDTGVDRGHPDLAGVLLPGATFVRSPSAICPDGDGQDDNSHGTHIAGIIAALGDNGIGISGVAFGVRILPVKALDCVGFGSTADIAEAIVWATDHGARIVNVSLGTSFDSAALDAAVRYALDRNVLVVAAAGNCGGPSGRCLVPDQPEYPAAFPGVLAVGATDPTDTVASFSTRGPQVALVAPGVGITSTLPRYPTYGSFRGETLGYGALTGTSQSSAFVAGVAALMWSARPTLTAREIFDALVATAEDVARHGRDDAYGAGRVNALRAVLRVQSSAKTQLLSLAPSDFARKVAEDAALSGIGRLIQAPLVVHLVTGEVVTLR